MFRIDSEGSTIDNKFTEGDPALSVPATVVSDDWLNHVQEELALWIEFNDIVLSKANDNQLQASMLEFLLRGGRKKPYKAEIENNSGPLDLEDDNNGDATFEIDSSKIKALICTFTMERKTVTQNKQETGFLSVTWDSADSVWKVRIMSSIDDCGVSFTTALVAGTVHKVKYTSDDLTGATYSGWLNITSITEIRI